MAKLSSDGKYVTVEKGDTLWDIAETYLGSGLKYKQLAAINNISNPDLISVGRRIQLYNDGSSANNASANSNKPTITDFGEVSNTDNTLFATWSWSKNHTQSYKALWTYSTGDGVWFSGSNNTITVDEDAPELAKQSTYSIPANAKQVRFKVKPIPETYTKNKKEVNYWEAAWSDLKTWTDSTPLTTPGTPSVEIVKYKLTATLDNIDIPGATHIEFQVVKNNTASAFATKQAAIVSAHASHAFTVDSGSEYKVRARAYNSSKKTYSEWSQYSGNEQTIPATPGAFTVIRANSETSVYLEWKAVNAADTYEIEYTKKKDYFDNSSDTSTATSIEFTHFEITGLETGSEYFFRLRARNEAGESGWSDIKSCVIGSKPAAPTTWSSTTTAIVGEPLNLYWVHNTEDGSSQTFAELELIIGGVTESHTIKNSEDEDEKDKTSVYSIDTSTYVEGIDIKWRVKTAGITKEFGEWSVERTIDIYAPPTLELRMTDIDGDPIETLTAFPFYIYGLAGPNTQVPIGYHVSIVANESYETVDGRGNPLTINVGDTVYSKYFDTDTALLVEMSANNVDLENNIPYTITCRVSMDSGLTAESSINFTVTWTDLVYEPNAEFGLDSDTMTMSIRPYCVDAREVRHSVTVDGDIYTLGDALEGTVWGEVLPGAKLDTGELVYEGMNGDGEEVYYCYITEMLPVEDVLLSVYRREFDGSFTELITGLDSAKATTITDPHPALDYARYRIVAISKTTGAVSYYDPPGYPVGGTAAIIQWDEEWTPFEVTNEDELVQPPWTGSMLVLPYNIDVTDSYSPEVSLVDYIGREHPVTYYGTHQGHAQNWSIDIPKSDKETLYALRRLAKWMGDVYVREPSGSGYWANIVVSFSQTHCEVTIPVTFKITRVEGGA